MSDLLEHIELKREDNFNYWFVCDNGAMKRATMAEVLQYKILKTLQDILAETYRGPPAGRGPG
jgi:hypothetical protein